jgi:pSer/pThr/pTyr-binding forkhead associated (FHA) protein
VWRVTALDREGHEVGHFELASGELTIGRDTDRQLILPSASVSRRHARVIINGTQPCIVDDGSSNGVIVDGVKIAALTAVGPANRIDLAEFRITIMPVGGVVEPRAGDRVLRLVADGGPYDGRVFQVPMQPATVGRALENELVFDDPSLSRKHARLERDGDGVAIEDLGSSNGTFVNSRKIGRASAVPGDLLQFGDLVFRVEGPEVSGTRAVDTSSSGSQLAAVAIGGALTLAVLIGAVVALAHKIPPVQASGKEAIARLSRQADQHLRTGRTLYQEKKYAEAKSELDAALDLDPANREARKLSRLAAHGTDDDRALASAQAGLKIADRKGLEGALRWLGEITDGSGAREQLQAKLVPALEQFGDDRCQHHSWADCAWALCRAYESASGSQDRQPSADAARALRDAEKHLAHDRTYVRCRAAPEPR